MIEPQTPPEPYKITSEYLDYLIGILTGTVTPKAAAEFIPVLEIAQMAQLGTAWAEAVEALPEGWGLLEITRHDESHHHCCDWDYLEADWTATAGDIRAASVNPGDAQIGAGESATGPTPAAALRALAAKLRETGGR